MFERERQVILTYTTWRWMWLFLPLALLMMLGSAFQSLLQINTDGVPFFFGMIGIGMPICFCVQWFVAVTKWQFANSRAQLMPGYVGPHLAVVFTILLVPLIANPILQALCQGISPAGPLAYALLLGGLFLSGMFTNRGALTIPAVVVFFSGMFPRTSHFWYSDNSDFLATHISLILIGTALTVWWLWQLAHLHEEDEGYFVIPLGYPGSMSRLEGDILRRFQGRMAARSGLWQMLADRWHDRLMDRQVKPSALSDYGWGKIQPDQQAVLVCVGFALYGLLLDQLMFHWGNHPGRASHILLYFFAAILPAVAVTGSLCRRRPRFAQELLRPASRTAYLYGLFRSLAKQTLLFWLAMTAGLWIVVLSNPSAEEGNLVEQLASFTIWSLALQFPALAIGLLVARLRSLALPFIGFVVLITFGTSLMGYWNAVHKFSPLEFFRTIPAATTAALGFVIIGLLLFAWARRSWLSAELG